MMAKAEDLDPMILPPMSAFYHKPDTTHDIIDQAIGKALDYFELDHRLFRRWREKEQSSAAHTPRLAPADQGGH